jgi:hypothetical protein
MVLFSRGGPPAIRLIGLAFKVKVFDMVSDGKQFRIYVPPKNKFILGRNDQEIKGRKMFRSTCAPNISSRRSSSIQ